MRGLGAFIAGGALVCTTALAQSVQIAPPAFPTPVTSAFLVESRFLDAARPIFVALPRSYSMSRRSYPVIVVLDGEANFVDTANIAATLASLGHIPEAIVVGIPNAGADYRSRLHDLTPAGLSVGGSTLAEGGDQFLDFIEKDALPAVARRYRAGGPTILVGHSSGGVLATYAAATRNASFPVVVAIDSPVTLQNNWLADKLIGHARAAPASRLRYVSIESRFGWTDAGWSALGDAAPRGWRLRREHLDGESHNSMVYLALYQGLKLAFDDFSIVGAPLVPRASARAAFDYYHAIETGFGTSLPPPEPVLVDMVRDLLTEGRTVEARKALQWLTEGYGAGANTARLTELIKAVEAMPKLTETAEQLDKTPAPTLAEIKPYLGEWRGQNWINPASPTEIGLTIYVVDGRPVADMRQLVGTETKVDRATYLKVTPKGLEFGRLNGQRPRAVLINNGIRTGDVLEGTVQFRGVITPLPDETAFPTIRFRLKRQRGS